MERTSCSLPVPVLGWGAGGRMCAVIDNAGQTCPLITGNSHWLTGETVAHCDPGMGANLHSALPIQFHPVQLEGFQPRPGSSSIASPSRTTLPKSTREYGAPCQSDRQHPAQSRSNPAGACRSSHCRLVRDSTAATMSARKLGGGRILGSGKGLAPPPPSSAHGPRAASPFAPSESSTASVNSRNSTPSSLSPPSSGPLADFSQDLAANVTVDGPSKGAALRNRLACPICGEEMVGRHRLR